MPGHLSSYFLAEKQESLLFVAIGLAAIAAAISVGRRWPRYRAGAYPLVVIALIQLTVGGTVFVRTDRQMAALAEQRRVDPQAFRASEGARMAKVMANFQVYKTIEIAILAAGVGLVALLRKRPTFVAVGIGCMLQGGAMLVFDLFAEARGQTYIEAIGAE